MLSSFAWHYPIVSESLVCLASQGCKSQYSRSQKIILLVRTFGTFDTCLTARPVLVKGMQGIILSWYRGLVLQQRFEMSGPVGVMRLPGAGLAASPV